MALSREEIDQIARASADEISERLQPRAQRVISTYINEHKAVGDKMVQKYSILGTYLIVYNAWEPSGVFGPHSTITTIDEKWYGQIGTRRLSPDVEKLPAGSKERIEAVGKAFEDQYQEAYNLILQAYPEAAAGRRSMGEIEMTQPHF